MAFSYDYYRIFYHAAKYGSFTQAARILSSNQPNITRAMNSLEAQLGCKLFERTAKGVTLTEEGRYFYEQFNPIVMNYRNTVSQTIAHLEHIPKKVAFACGPFIFRALGAGLLLSFQDANPEITLERLEMSDKDVDDYVGADETHFGMLAIPENRHGARFDYIPVKTLPLYLLVHKDHPLAEENVIDFAMLRDENFLTLEKRSHYHSMINDKAKGSGFKPRNTFSFSDIDQICALVNEGKGIFIAVDMPSVKSQYPNIVMRPFADETINYSIAIIFRNYEKLDGATTTFIEYVVECV